MKVLLWDATSKLYVQDEDCWTAERELAHNFFQSAYAFSFAMRKRLEHAQVLLTFDRRELDVALPVELPPEATGPGACI